MFRKKDNKGFSIIEILMVLVIIGILAVIGFTVAANTKEKAKIAEAQAQLKEIYNAIAMLENDTECWPKASGESWCKDTEVELGAGGNEVWDLVASDAGLAGDDDAAFLNWQGPYLTDIGLDPWGNPYFLDTDYDIDPGAGQTWAAVIGSFGPNGVGQNVYDSDNIILILKSE